ncbi:DUF2891 family protein [Austwickia sp. TVS 96-490-7B]|uniref:DUF2891 family protein n=1 Tax=Austwickia sp. TVS 96-490-7B TaxID=2830843 RepID=UPI001C5810F4|nr:DUF2891 family protein [Austwickia sp. TVS 96-490-7B]
MDTPFPYAAGHVSNGPQDCEVTPPRLHPVFHGCLDWHSSAHMQWSLVTLLTVAADQLDDDLTDRVVSELTGRVTAEQVTVEVEYVRAHPGFERPYGWAWAAMWWSALQRCPLPQARGWALAAAPLAELVWESVPAWLDRQTYPVRHGGHANSAFAVMLLSRAARQADRGDIVDRLARAAREWFVEDTDYDTRFEPSGHDFLSPALTEAACLAEVLPRDEFTAWLAAFLPGLGADRHRNLLQAPTVTDGADGQQAHLYGLALSRAWQLRMVAPSLPESAAQVVLAAAQQQEASTAPVITGGDFMATHWLVSFALLAQLAQ